ATFQCPGLCPEHSGANQHRPDKSDNPPVVSHRFNFLGRELSLAPQPWLFCAAGFARLLSWATRSAHSQFTQNDLQGAEIGEGGLQQIESNESGEPKPIGTVVVGQRQAEEDEGAGKSANDHFHKRYPSEFSENCPPRAPQPPFHRGC